MSGVYVNILAQSFIRRGAVLGDGSNVEMVVDDVKGGGFGVVALGFDRHDRVRRALKTFNPYIAHDADDLKERIARFKRTEAGEWCGLWPHPNILRAVSLVLIDVTAALDGQRFMRQPFLLLEYAEGQPVRDILGAGWAVLGDADVARLAKDYKLDRTAEQRADPRGTLGAARVVTLSAGRRPRRHAERGAGSL